MTSHRKHADTITPEKVPDKTPKYRLDEDNRFTVPYAGTYKLHVVERYVAPVPPTDSIVKAKEVVSHSNPTTGLEKSIAEALLGPDVNLVYRMQFESTRKLKDDVPRIAELSLNLENVCGAKPHFVFGVAQKGHRDLELGFDPIRSALRTHKIDGLVVAIPHPVKGGRK
jgi:hypothetical protein